MAMLFICLSCIENQESIKLNAIQEILQTDRSFSSYSKTFGMKKAFLKYAHDSVVMLKTNSMPLVGKTALENSYMNLDDSKFTLTWIPSFANVSESGDLGYSYGIYTLTFIDESQSPEQGTYCSIWKRNKTREWRFVLDSGNEGLK